MRRELIRRLEALETTHSEVSPPMLKRDRAGTTSAAAGARPAVRRSTDLNSMYPPTSRGGAFGSVCRAAEGRGRAASDVLRGVGQPGA